MAGYAKDEDHVLHLSLMALAVIAVISGLLIHSFITGINLYEWSKGRSITPVDHIVTVLGISRMGIQFADIPLFVFASSMRSLDPYVNSDIFNAIYLFFIYTNIWLTTLLLIVFYLKISNLHSRLFLYLRGMILPRTGQFIVASGLLAAVMSFLPLWTDMTNRGTYNTTVDNQFISCMCISSMLNFTVGSSIALLFYVISSVLLFTSLYHHTVKMKMSNSSITLETYYSVMKFVSFTFIYNIIYLIGHFLCSFFYYFHCLDPTWPYVFLDILPVLHSSYLIYRTAKLKNQMSKILQNIFFLFQSKPETRETIE